MGTFGVLHYRKTCLAILLLLLPLTHTANLREALKLDSQSLRIPRDGSPPRRYAASREDPPPSRPTLQRPENTLDPDPIGPPQPVEKRCSRCDPLYPDYRYDQRTRYYDDYDRRPAYSNNRDRYQDYPEDRYNNRYDAYDRYDGRDRYYERDRDRDRYNQDRRPYDYDDRDYRYYDRYNERGLGYDNRGYDYRTPTDRGGYRPWDQTTRGASGWDNAGRGYYFASGRPSIDEQGSYGGGYASRWSYGSSGSGRDDYYDRGGYYGRGREPPQDTNRNGYGYGYLYGRPSTTTTDFPSNNPAEGNRTSSNNS